MNELMGIWKAVETASPPPKSMTSIAEIEFNELRKMVDSSDWSALKRLAIEMYEGKAFILRNAAPERLRDVMLALAEEYNSKHPSSFYKMYDGCPNFHRVITEEITKKYSLYAIKHSFYFYNWNARSHLEREFKELVYHHWRYVKFLAGNEMYQYENNIPSDGQIDRLQIVNYPRGGGQLREHEDPRKNQRIVSGLIMSKLGVDFETGGFYFNTSDGASVNIENQLNIGDSVMFYGSVVHGVEAVDSSAELDWSLDVGRWFIGMFVNDSDHVVNRTTAKDMSNSL